MGAGRSEPSMMESKAEGSHLQVQRSSGTGRKVGLAEWVDFWEYRGVCFYLPEEAVTLIGQIGF